VFLCLVSSLPFPTAAGQIISEVPDDFLRRFVYKPAVVINLSEKEDEQKIFETINSAGVRLSSSDIIKNAGLFSLTEMIVLIKQKAFPRLET
jgi:hypothetical protein